MYFVSLIISLRANEKLIAKTEALSETAASSVPAAICGRDVPSAWEVGPQKPSDPGEA